MLQTEVTKTKAIKLSQTCQECNSARTREKDAVSFNVRIYWITSNSFYLGGLATANASSFIPISIININYSITYHTSHSKYNYMCVCYTYRHIYPYMLHIHNIYRLHICAKYIYVLNIWTAYMGYIYNITYIHTYLCVHMCICVCV